tara:strand:- start:9466 stop:13968 length:4503 start_codon:yes stop_codon:yes gene_type:complete
MSTRTVPGYGAVIEPIFDEKFGVRAIQVVDGGEGYDITNPPRLTVTGCGTPTQEALLYPIIDELSGRIVHVRVLERGLGYDPLRLQIIPTQDTPTVIQSFDINRIWQSHPNSPTTGLFTSNSDRLRIQSDNHPKPTPLLAERAPGGGSGGTLAQYTPSAINYNPTTGLMEMTIGSHSYTTGDSIKIATDSLTFTCALDDHGTDHTYPRATDPVAGVAIPILSTTSTTITVQVLGVAPATNTSAHTFKSATFGAVSSGGSLVDRSFDQTYIFRGGKDAPHPDARQEQLNKSLGIMANGVQLHTPEWGQAGNPTPGFSIDAVKHSHIKSNTSSDAVVDGNTYYYQSSRLISEFAEHNGVFDWGKIRPFTWNIKTEFDNLMFEVGNVDETLGVVERGRTIDAIATTAKAEIAKIVRNNLGTITHIYVRNISGSDVFAENNVVLGSTGFSFKILEPPTTLTNGIFYIEFGPDSTEFGPFVEGQYYFAPENIKVQRNYLIIWNQSDSTNQPSDHHPHGHPMQFSTTQDGLLNGGSLYYKSTGITEAPSTDYENEFKPLFIMNGDENSRIYYYCKYHRYMSGYEGHEGYMTLDLEIDDDPLPNDYYITDYYQSNESDPSTIDYSRHADGHSKILGMAFDGYPIYGPYGYDSTNTVAREVTGFRYRVGDELAGARPDVVTAETITYAVTVANGEFNIDGSTVPFLSLWRGKTYVFQQNDSSNDNEQLLISTTDDGWHAGTPPDTTYLFEGPGITYWLEGSEVTYSAYISGFNTATAREIRFEVPVTAPLALYTFGYTTSGIGIRTVQDGYVIGDLVQDYIWDTSVGTLDEHNGKFAVTPEYPNGTYAYFLTENGSGVPTYPYAIGPTMYGTPLFEGDIVPAQPDTFPDGAAGDVVLNTDGTVSYVKMTKKGDNYFGAATARILGGEGTGATGTPTVQTVTGLSLLQGGRDYATPPTLIFEGGGGQGAQGAAEIDVLGRVTNINIVDEGEYYQEPPYILINGGGGIGAKAIAKVAQGVITDIEITDPGSGYIDQPKVIFTKLVNLKRKSRARQAYNSVAGFLTGLVKDVLKSDTELYVDSTDAFPGSGELILNKETIAYTAKSKGKFSGLTRGVNFNFDQRIVLDAGQIDGEGNSTYKFNVNDRVIRKIENEGNKVAKVYDWDPTTRELLVTFEVDELAFIDAGIPSTEDAIVQFDAGLAASAPGGFNPHVLLDVDSSEGAFIIALTEPISQIIDKEFEDNDELDGAGDGIIDLVNAGTDYENQINLDGGIHTSLYGIEETQGGQNTTLFQVGDQVKDGSLPFKYATVSDAGTLTDGVPHTALIKLFLDPNLSNGLNFGVNEIVTGSVSGVRATVVSWDPVNSVLIVQDITPFNTGNVNVGIGGYLYEFSHDSTVVDFIIQSPGTNYTAVPTVTVENVGDIQCTATVNLTSAQDQVASCTIVNGGYGIVQSVDNTYNTHPTVTFVNAVGDSTGSGAAAQVVMGGEDIMGNGGATYRLSRIEYSAQLRS